MKKLLLTLLFVCTAATMFAYRSSPGDEIGYAIINLAIVIIGILNIILFYKIWEMTNDVKKIKNKFYLYEQKNYLFKKKFMKLKLTGEVEEAKKMVDESLKDEVYAKLLVFGVPVEQMQKDVEKIIRIYDNYYKCLDCEMPKEIKELDVAKVKEDFSSFIKGLAQTS